MLEFKIRFPEKKDADNLNHEICSWFQGWDKFIIGKIIVTPVYTGWHNNKQNFFFDILIAANINKTIELEGGTLGMEVKNHPIWAIVREDQNAGNKTSEDKKN